MQSALRLGISFMVLCLVLGVAIRPELASAAPTDPSPYCRPTVGTPYIVSGPTYIGNEQYSFSVRVEVHLSCNGSIVSGAIYALDHYSTTGSASGLVSGAGATCRGSCNAYVDFRRTLVCLAEYTYSHEGQITGYWQRTSSSGKVTVSEFGPLAGGSSFYPSVCP